MSNMMIEWICVRCGGKCGSSSAKDAEVGLCMNCREDDIAIAKGRPMCTTCGQRRVTCSDKAFAEGCRICRNCAYNATVDAAQDEYKPVFDLIREFNPPGVKSMYVEQTGGMTMVAYVYGDPEHYGTGTCKCERPVVREDGRWVHQQDDNGCEEPAPDPTWGHPCLVLVHDQDEHWYIGFERFSEDYEDNAIFTEDLRVNPDGIYGSGDPYLSPEGDYATAEDVAARALLLLEDPDLPRRGGGEIRYHYQNFEAKVTVDVDWLDAQPARSFTPPQGPDIAKVIDALSSVLFGVKEFPFRISSVGPRSVVERGTFWVSLHTRSLLGDVTAEELEDAVRQACPFVHTIESTREGTTTT